MDFHATKGSYVDDFCSNGLSKTFSAMHYSFPYCLEQYLKMSERLCSGQLLKLPCTTNALTYNRFKAYNDEVSALENALSIKKIMTDIPTGFVRIPVQNNSGKSLDYPP